MEMFIKKHSKKLMMLAATGIVAFPLAVNAASTTIDATAKFLQTITLANATPIAFGTIEYSAAPGGADTVSMGTDGSIAVAGVFSSSAGSGTAGSVDIATGTSGETVHVTCDLTAIMSNGAGASIEVDSLEVTDTDNAGAFGTATACDGLASVTPHIYVLGSGTDQLKFGGRIDGGAAVAFTDGDYSTATGGTPFNVQVVYP
ncbi:MAG: DUF4402 domain-containing protein [Pseudomonadota bacterium]|nr:MAG: DUF4402 domain-containing protein [Pseudomonadota bacterium]